MSGVLILFSAEMERAAAFPDGVPDGLRTGLSGVGPIEAALGTDRLIRERTPAWILFLGTCGAHAGSGIGVGDVVAARDVLLSSGDVARGQMRLPSLVPSRRTCDAVLVASLVEAGEGGVSAADVSCTLGITESAELAGLFRTVDGAAVENMEAFGVVRAAETIPCAILLGVTNLVGPGGGIGWKENHGEMMRRVWGYASKMLAAGGHMPPDA